MPPDEFEGDDVEVDDVETARKDEVGAEYSGGDGCVESNDDIVLDNAYDVDENSA